MYCYCVGSVSKRISNRILARLLFRPNAAKLNIFKNYRLDYWSGHSRTNRSVCYGPVDEPLKATDYFAYLGSTLSTDVNIDVEVNNILSKANSAFGRLRNKVWGRRGICQDTKLDVCMAVPVTVLLYTCESWTVYSRHARKLNHFHTKCLRIIVSIDI